MTQKNKITPNLNLTASISEEIANGITHGIGALLAIAGLVLLVVQAARHGNAWHVVSYSIFGSTMVLLYLSSTLYHSIQRSRVKAFLKIIDHSAIFLLIAGTYTPFLLVSLRGAWGWTLFGIIWGLAVTGIILKSIFIHRFRVVSVFIYIAMGWLIVIAMPQTIHNLNRTTLVFLLIGGVSYTLGTVFYLWKKLPFSHAIWHLFVLGGTITHFFAVLNIL
ncbi:MAG: hemolysin III family protein [Candidatus Marinimicrobia bacterium]|nr:hemolysin III family protein [Candidatus Neomarinimicrobiota bacterium]